MNENDNAHVTALLVVHDGVLWLPEVVASLASQTRTIDSTIAIDTGSTDASAKLLKNAHVQLISLPRDSGFGAAIAAAVATLPAMKSENEWLWLIHDDCAPQSGALEAMLAAAHDRPQVAVAGPKLLGWYDRTHLLEVGVSIAGNGSRWTGLEAHEYDQGQHDGVREVLSVSTAGALIRRSVFEELGGFDANLRLFRDDVDFGWRAHLAGHSVIAVTDAVAFHAEASASERRSVDVKGALLNRPLLLDRRNAAYVLLANSSWWILPWLAIQLFIGAGARSLGYLLAKLPGYASDEFLAVALLLVRPAKIWEARKRRRSERLISSRTVSRFIPPRWSQVRLALSRSVASLRENILPSQSDGAGALSVVNEDEDLLTPSPPLRWRSAFRRPEIAGVSLLIMILALWARLRYGSLSGGALSTTPSGAIDLWRRYGESWHQVGMGNSDAAPPWIALLAMLATLFLGKADALMSFLFWVAPLVMGLSSYSMLRKFSRNSWLLIGASFAYALSPVAITSVNSGRLGTVAVLILGPRIVGYLPRFIQIDEVHWRMIFGVSLLIGVVTSFTLLGYLSILVILVVQAVRDYLEYRKTLNRPLYLRRLQRRLVLTLSPFLLALPWSLDAFIHPSRFLLEPGLLLEAGAPNLVLFANPGGPGSPPWWLLSPVTFVVFAAAFSTSKVRRYANFGIVFILLATLLSTITIAGHGSTASTRIWTGTLLADASIATICCGVIILDGLRQRLAAVQFHFRHVLGGLVIAVTLIYAVAASGWVVTVGTNSPVQANRAPVLPSFLALTPGTKTLVIRNLEVGTNGSPSYFIARASDAILGDADMAPENSATIESAVRDIVDGSGLNSSRILAGYGIKYLFMANPVIPQLVRAVDGLGGFVRTSSTQAGIVWRLAGLSDRLVFTDGAGKAIALPTLEVSATGSTPSAGTLTLAESYDSSWQVIQGAQKLKRLRSDFDLPVFQSNKSGEFILIHDGTKRRAWLSLEIIVLLTMVVLALPSGRRRSEISREELT